MFTNEQRVGDICKNINEKLSNTKRSFCKKIECSLSDLMLNVSDSLSQARCPFFSSSESSFSSLFSQATVSSFWTPPDALVWFCFQISVVFRSRSSITAVYSLFFRLKRTSIRIWNIPLKKKNSETAKHKKHFQICRFEISIWFEEFFQIQLSLSFSNNFSYDCHQEASSRGSSLKKKTF